nr:MAG TPA: hypothetical protein [Caudoviricetes sp.]
MYQRMACHKFMTRHLFFMVKVMTPYPIGWLSRYFRLGREPLPWR